MGAAAIFDRDDTLADAEGGSAKHLPGDWAGYNKALVGDKVLPKVKAWWDSVPPGVARIMVTGRDESVRPEMEKWLAANDIKPDKLLMRPADDNGSNAEFKRHALAEVRKTYDSILYAVDDKDETLAMYRDEGVLAIDAKKINA